MFYVAIAFIMAGLCILGYTIITNTTRSNNNTSENNDKRYKKSYSKQSQEQKPITQEVPPQVAHAPVLAEQRTIEKQNIDRMDLNDNNNEQENALPAGAPDRAINVLYYEDNSNIIDYQSNSGTIDPSLKEYKKIKLIGKGELHCEKEGLSFFIGKKFRRFDFYSITEMQSGNDYLAVFTKSGPVKLFVINNNSPFISHVINDFNNSKQ